MQPALSPADQKHRLTTRLWGFLIVVCLLFVPYNVIAQEEDGVDVYEIDHFQIDILPEYDRSEVLVTYQIHISEDVFFPAHMTIRIPLQSIRPHSLAMRDMGGMLFNLSYSGYIQGEWIVLEFETPSPEIQLQYYDPGIQRTGKTRKFQFTWNEDYLVHSLTVKVQKPANARNLKITPDMGNGHLGQDGLTYYTMLLNEVDLSTPVKIGVVYDRDEDAPSTQLLDVQPVEPINMRTSGRISFPMTVTLAIILLGLALAGLSYFWYWFAQRRGRQTGRAGGSYCPRCGGETSPGDAYCRACGAKL